MFDLTHKPEIGIAMQIQDAIQVVTAPNPSPMTFTGTRTYILGESNVAIIDPGPDDNQHYLALKVALKGRKLGHICVTHSHSDHSPLAKRLSREFDAPVMAYGNSRAGRSSVMEELAKLGNIGGGEGIDSGFKPDILLKDNQKISGDGWVLEAIHTPGHMANHLCYAFDDVLFSGDHVMGWSSTLVSPPDGDLTQYMRSMNKLKMRDETTYLPGHGAPIRDAQAMLDHQITHRLLRESQILQVLAKDSLKISEITEILYADLDKRLWPAAGRNVLAHIIDLTNRGLVHPLGVMGTGTRFKLV